MKNSFSILLVALILLWGCGSDKDQQEALEKMPVSVSVVRVRSGDFSKYLDYQGTVSPWKKANIAPDVSGRIWKIYKKQGDRVSRGTLLAELDTTTLKLQEKQALAALAVAEATQKDARLNYVRLKKLHARKAVSQMQLEKAQLALESAETQRKSAEANLNVIRHTLGNSYMRAPFDGIITSKNMEEGDMINPMMGMGASVLTLMDLKKVKVVLDIPSEDIEKIKIDQKCVVSVESLGEKTFHGTVYSKNLAADPLSKTFKVEVQIENPGIEIKAGVFAEVRIEILHKQGILLLPLSAVIDSNRVVIFEEGKARNVTVETGVKNDEQVEILNGLSEGQQVVVEGNYDLKDGTPIRIQGAAP